MKMTRFLFLILLSLLIACESSSDTETNEFDRPHNPSLSIQVDGIGPTKGGLGTKVVVSGSNFGNDKEKVTLLFNDKKALILRVQDNAIYALVPKQPGEFSTIKVIVDGKEAVLEGTRFKYYIKAVVTTIAEDGM